MICWNIRNTCPHARVKGPYRYVCERAIFVLRFVYPHVSDRNAYRTRLQLQVCAISICVVYRNTVHNYGILMIRLFSSDNIIRNRTFLWVSRFFATLMSSDAIFSDLCIRRTVLRVFSRPYTCKSPSFATIYWVTFVFASHGVITSLVR